MEAKRRYLKIFLSTLYLSAFTFGGGYVIVSLLRKKFVEELHWIDQEEMLDLVAIAQSSPGAIAVNGAIVVGYRLGGFPGILCAVLGAVIPPFVILTLVSMFYGAFRDHPAVQALLRGMKSGVAAEVIGVASGSIGEKLYESKIYFMTEDLLAWTVVIVLISVLFEKLFLRLMKAAFDRWEGR